MRLQVRIANGALGVILNTFFRSSYSAKWKRWNFDFLAGVSQEKLARKYPAAKFESVQLGPVAAEVVVATPHPQWELFYLHGGGYTMGSLKAYRRNALRLAFRLNARVTLVDYRLAPECPFPAALEDSVAAYQAFLTQTSPEKIVMGGDSAGGGLALATLLYLRDHNIPLPVKAFCLSAWTDLTASGESVLSNRRKDCWLSQRSLQIWGAKYYGAESARHPYVSPVFGSYQRIPPVFLLVGDQEVLQDDSLRVAERIGSAGGSAQLWLGKDMQHNWPFSLPFLPESKAAMKALSEFIHS